MVELFQKFSNLDAYLVIGVLIVFGLLEVISGHLSKTKRTRGDWIQEVGGFFVLSVLIKPAIVFLVIAGGIGLFEVYQNSFAEISLLVMLPIYLLIDDLLQYWYHRFAHEYPFLWRLHRPHHQAEEMGFFVSYRNAALYYVLMPNIWWVGLMTFLGAGIPVAIGLVLKQLVIIGSHSTVKWDQPLYTSRVFRPILSIVERIIVTPAFHYAHHGKSKVDGISDPNGNFGNMFSIWDQLFGTAIFSGKYPCELGLQNDPKEPWHEAYFHPFVKTRNDQSELSRNYTKSQTTVFEPSTIQLKKGKNYLWCQCGMSKDQPFCDGSHHGTKFKPLLFEAKKDSEAKLCNCKKTKSGPFCDNSHEKFLRKPTPPFDFPNSDL